MTINIGVVTSEALVLGCDSIASTSAYLVDPFAGGATYEPSEDGTMTIKGRIEHIQPYTTGARAGFTKMFRLSPDPCPVVAVTSGRAKLSERTVGSLAHEFCEKQGTKKTRQLQSGTSSSCSRAS